MNSMMSWLLQGVIIALVILVVVTGARFYFAATQPPPDETRQHSIAYLNYKQASDLYYDLIRSGRGETEDARRVSVVKVYWLRAWDKEKRAKTQAMEPDNAERIEEIERKMAEHQAMSQTDK